MEQNLLSWNVENWLTVLLMVLLGYGLVTLVSQLLLRYGGGSGSGPSLSMSSNINLAA